MNLFANNAGIIISSVKVIQNPIRNICIADFFLPHHNIVIFCDGEYWHNYPIGKERYYIQKDKLESIGFVVYRIWGRDIKSLKKLSTESV